MFRLPFGNLVPRASVSSCISYPAVFQILGREGREQAALVSRLVFLMRLT